MVTLNRVIDLSPSEFFAARQLAEAAKRRKELEARLEKERSNRELRALDQVIFRGSQQEQGVDLVLRITNISPNTLSVHSGPDISRIALRVDGPGAAFIRYRGEYTADLKVPPATRIRPGDSRDFRVKELRGGKRNADRWLITSPGRYTARLQFCTTIPTDAAGASGDQNAPLTSRRRLEEGMRIDLTTNEVTFNVTSGGQ